MRKRPPKASSLFPQPITATVAPHRRTDGVGDCPSPSPTMLRLARLPVGLLAFLRASPLLRTLPLSARASPPVSVAMKAAFPSPPYLVELLETAALDNTTRYFSLLENIAQSRFANANCDRDLYVAFLDVLQQDGHMDAEALSTFKLALSMRSAAPRIESHYHFYQTTVEPSLPADQEACEDWILLDGRQYCTPELRDAVAGRKLEPESRSSVQEVLLPYDRVIRATGAREAILYADIASPAVAPFHAAAMSMAVEDGVSYRVRYRKSAGHPDESLPVSGYGVELGLKRTDYIVIDDRAGSDTQGEEGGMPVVDSKEHGEADDTNKAPDEQVVMPDQEEDISDIKPLEKSDLGPLALKAASFVMQSHSPLDTLLRLTQDFPRYTTRLGGHNISAEFQAEYQQNSQVGLVPAGANVLWMNGVQLIDRQIQPFGLIDLLRRERRLVQGVLDLGLTGWEAVSLLGHNEVAQGRAEADESPRFDWRDDIEVGTAGLTSDEAGDNDSAQDTGTDEVTEGAQQDGAGFRKPRPRVIVWLNNLEKDKRYDGYSTKVWGLLQASGGGLPRIRKEVFDFIVPVDLSKPQDLQVVLTQLLRYLKQGIPVRFGFVPITTTIEAAEQAKVAYYLLDNYGLASMISHLEYSLEKAGSNPEAAGKPIRASEDGFAEAITDRDLRAGVTEALTVRGVLASAEGEEHVEKARCWASRLHADGSDGNPPPAFLNGLAFPRDDHWLRNMNQKLMGELRLIQQSVYFGHITDDTDIPSALLESAAPRRNALLYPDDASSGSQVSLVNIQKIYVENKPLIHTVPSIEQATNSTLIDWALLVLIVDLNSMDGRALLHSAMEFRREHSGVRVDIIHNPAEPAVKPASVLNRKLLSQAAKLLSQEHLSDLESLLAELDESEDVPEPSHDAALVDFLAVTGIRPGEDMVLLNGRAIGPIKPRNSLV